MTCVDLYRWVDIYKAVKADYPKRTSVVVPLNLRVLKVYLQRLL